MPRLSVVALVYQLIFIIVASVLSFELFSKTGITYVRPVPGFVKVSGRREFA